MSRPTPADEVVRRFHRLRDYVASDTMADAVTSHMKEIEHRYPGDPKKFLSHFGAVRSNLDLQEQLLAGMDQARMYQVSEETSRLVTGSWQNIKTNVTDFTWYHLPRRHGRVVEHGWAWLDFPVEWNGLDGTVLDASAISWDVTTLSPPWARMAAEFKAMLSRLENPDDAPLGVVDRPAVRLTYWKWTGRVTPLWPESTRAASLRHFGFYQLIPAHMNVIQLGGILGTPSRASEGGDEMTRWVKTLWGVMETPLTEEEEMLPRGRTQQRHQERFGDASPRVTVIRLRAPQREPGNSTTHLGTRNYTQQWIVLGYHRHKEHYIKAGNPPHEPAPPRGQDTEGKDTTCLTCSGGLKWVKASIRGPEGTEIKNPEQLFRI